jgi:hypothetical protein
MMLVGIARATDMKGTLYFIMNNRLYAAHENGKLAELLDPSKFGSESSVTLNGLSCGTGSSLLFFVTAVRLDKPGETPTTTTYRYDIQKKKAERLAKTEALQLGWPVTSPNGEKIAMLGLGYGKPDFLAIASGPNAPLEKYQYPRIGPPQSWEPRGGAVLLTGLDRDGVGTRVVRFDLREESFKELGSGAMPTVSPDGKLIATISSDQQRLVVSSYPNMRQVHAFRGFFKELGHWLSNDAVLVVSGRGYQDDIRIARVKTRKMSVIDVPIVGEIKGVCWMLE